VGYFYVVLAVIFSYKNEPSCPQNALSICKE